MVENPSAVWPLFLGGSIRPTGCGVTFLDAPLHQVRDAVLRVHQGRGVASDPEPLMESIGRLDPMEAPWTREALIECDGWTAYLNNGRYGGDISAVAPAVAMSNGWRCVTAQHVPRYGPGHAATQLWLQGPDGKKPLMDVRTLSAHSVDGRWSWHAWGEPQSFERIERYESRLKRDRLDRDLLVEYLGALAIRVDDPDFFGSAVSVSQQVDWPVRSESVDDFRTVHGW